MKKIENIMLRIFNVYIHFQFFLYVALTIYGTFKNSYFYEVMTILIVPTGLIGVTISIISQKNKFDSIIDHGRIIWLFKNSSKSIKFIGIIYLLIIVITIIFSYDKSKIIIPIIFGIVNYSLTCEIPLMLKLLKK